MRKASMIALLLLASALALSVCAQSKVHRGETVKITGRVVDELGNGISGATVQLKEGTKVLASTTSGSGGFFTLTWKVPLSHELGPKELMIYVPEQPSSYVEESKTTLILEIWDGTTLKLSLLPQRIHRGDYLTISGTLVTLGDEKGVSGAKILVGQNPMGSAVTDSNRQFKFSFKVPSNWKRGPVTIIAEFEGSSKIYLDGSEASQRTALWVKPNIEVESVSSG